MPLSQEATHVYDPTLTRASRQKPQFVNERQLHLEPVSFIEGGRLQVLLDETTVKA